MMKTGDAKSAGAPVHLGDELLPYPSSLAAIMDNGRGVEPGHDALLVETPSLSCEVKLRGTMS